MPSNCKFKSPSKPRRLPRIGLTLIEILIALTMTLIVLGAMMSAFQFASAEMQNGRAVLEMANRTRVVENLLRRDLANLTVEPRPYIGKVIPNGYFEYVEGPRRDLRDFFRDGSGSAPLVSIVTADSYLGDIDDILAMTVKSTAGSVFRGRQQGSTTPVESAFAEVIWWTTFSDSDQNGDVDYTDNVVLFRRVLVINPDLPVTSFASYEDVLEWFKDSDISARVELSRGTWNIIPNSLQDLSNRRNRFAKISAEDPDDGNIVPDSAIAFPYPTNRGTLLQTISSTNNDIVLNDIAGFDVKVFADDCAVRLGASGILEEPGDAAFPATAVDTDGDGMPNGIDIAPTDAANSNVNGALDFIATGAYVDLAHSGGGKFAQARSGTLPRGYFVPGQVSNTVPRAPLNYQFNFHQIDASSGLNASFNGLLETVYDTWSPTYESDGINQDEGGAVNPFPLTTAEADILDQGTDGIDNDGANGPDDFNERETQPPYNHPITGLKVTIRLVEKQTGEVRQTSVIQSYGAQ